MPVFVYVGLFTLSCFQFKLFCNLDKLGKIKLEWCVASFPLWLTLCCILGGSVLHFLQTGPVHILHLMSWAFMNMSYLLASSLYQTAITCFCVHEGVTASYLQSLRKSGYISSKKNKKQENILFWLSLIPPEHSMVNLRVI